MGIFAGHAPVLSTLRPGVVVVSKDGGTTEKIFVRGGFAEVNVKGLTILAETAITMTDLDASALSAQIKSAEDEVAAAKDEEGKRRAIENLDHLKGLQSAV